MITKEELNKLYKEWNENIEVVSPLEFLSDSIFDFTTYDSEYSEKIALMMLDVLKCILQEKTFEYIADESKYLNYILMVNMPFLIDKIEWGTSIRGAWFDGDETKQSIKNILEWVNGD